MRRRSTRLAALTLALGVASCPPGLASARASQTPQDGPDLGELWRDAQTKLGTSDYSGAIDSLTTLYEVVALDPEATALRLRVQWALHQAHLGAYDVDGDPSHLYQARDLLEKLRDDSPPARAEEVEQALLAVEQQIATHEAQERAAAEARAEAQARQAEAEARRAEAQAAAARAAADASQPPPPPDPLEPRQRDRAFVISGSTLLGVGAGATALMIAGFATASRATQQFETEPQSRGQARDQIELGNTLGIAGAISAGALLIPGAALLAVGLRSSKQRGSAALPRPTAGRRSFGLVWRGRF